MRRLCCLLPLILLWLTGCETPADTEMPNLKEPFMVKRGTTAEELIAVLGEPHIRHPVAEYSVDAEIWVYNRTVGSNSKMIMTGTESQPYWDPTERRVIWLEMPVYEPEVTASVEVTEIMMLQDQVYSWERKTSSRQEIDGVAR